MRAIIVSVDYSDILSITLPNTLMFFEKILIVTDLKDKLTEITENKKIEVYRTDAFYRNGAIFNKGLALEEGFDVLQRYGWICVLDADIVLRHWYFPNLEIGKLYSARRRIMTHYQPLVLKHSDWSCCELKNEQEHGGWFQVFHAKDPVLKEKPWYGTQWIHAGGCDSTFQARWNKNDKIWLPWEVMHIGETGKNWCGRSEDAQMRLRNILAKRAETSQFQHEWIQT